MKSKNDIVSAPSKWELSVAFFDRIGGHRRPISFQLKGEDFPHSAVVEVVINSLSWEDGSGESWCFKGYCANGGQRVRGWFTTNYRQRWIEPTN